MNRPHPTPPVRRDPDGTSLITASEGVVAALTLAEKCALVAGQSWWRTPAVARLGIPPVKMTDGPNGARGEGTGDDATPAVLLPAGIVQGATWDPGLVERAGELLGREARRRQAHVLLAPSVNLHRTPIGGRTFEYYSEDPELTARLAVAAVRGIQSQGVAATVKHFAANDTEVDRFSVDVRVGERVLRELYLRPFEACVREAGTWAVMSAYNRLDGEFCAANRRLLTTVLREEWGFDGAVISDWYGTHDAVGCATAGLSLEMPGPPRFYGSQLEQAVTGGRVEESVVDALVHDVLRLIERTHAADRPCEEPEASVDDPADRALCREIAIAGTVLAKNDGRVLPVVPAPGLRVAVLGPNAADTRAGGGGSASLRSLPQTSVLDALRGRFDVVLHEPGVAIDKFTPLARPGTLVGPDEAAGLEVAFLDGTAVTARTRSESGHLRFAGSLPEGVSLPCTVQLRGSYLPDTDGTYVVGLVTTGAPHCVVDGRTLTVGGELPPRGDAYYGLGSAEQLVSVDCRAGRPVALELDLLLQAGFAAVRIGVQPPPDDGAFDRAVQAARTADVAVVVVGTNDEWETEGADRASLSLPGRQDELVAAVAAANPRTVVVLNAGSPMSMPWLDAVPALLVPFFGGMEMGEAVADVITGVADPGGRLPTTFPRSLEDVVSWPHYAPRNGVQTYAEGLLVGYRGADAHGVDPLLPFGHGLSYGAATWGAPTASTTSPARGEPVVVTVPVTAGERDATVVVQGYVAPVSPPVPREPKALKAWEKLVVAAGTTAYARLTFSDEAFRRWDEVRGDWVVDGGDVDLVIAASATDARSVVRITL